MSDSYADHAPLAVTDAGLTGRVAVVTGAAGGIGAAFAAGLAERGVRVVAADLDLAAIEKTVATIAGDVRAARVDVVDPSSHDALAGAALDAFGRLDFWINNAGVFPEATIPDVPPEQLRDVLAVNVEGVLHGSQAAARVMQPGAAIVNMASVAARRIRRGRAAYCASKAAVEHLTRSLAVELGDRGIRVNAIAPGFVDTAMTRWIHERPGVLAQILERTPLHRVGSPQEILGPLLFLLSDAARYVTGNTIVVDGGSSLV